MMTLGDARKKSSSSNNISAFLLNNPSYLRYRAPRVAPSNTLPFSGEPKTRFPTTMLHDISNMVASDGFDPSSPGINFKEHSVTLFEDFPDQNIESSDWKIVDYSRKFANRHVATSLALNPARQERFPKDASLFENPARQDRFSKKQALVINNEMPMAVVTNNDVPLLSYNYNLSTFKKNIYKKTIAKLKDNICPKKECQNNSRRVTWHSARTVAI